MLPKPKTTCYSRSSAAATTATPIPPGRNTSSTAATPPHANAYQVHAYPLGTRPDHNWRPAIFSFGKNLSPCGEIEYHSPQPAAPTRKTPLRPLQRRRRHYRPRPRRERRCRRVNHRHRRLWPIRQPCRPDRRPHNRKPLRRRVRRETHHARPRTPRRRARNISDKPPHGPDAVPSISRRL